MQTLTERPTAQPGPGGTLDGRKVRRFYPRGIPPEKAQLGQEWDDGKGPSRVLLSATGLTAKIAAGFSWLFNLLAGPPMSQRDRFRYSVKLAQVQKHKALATCWAHQPTRGIF